MTQTVAVQPPAPPAPPASFAEDVPSVLTRLQALAVAACLVFGVVAAVLQVLAWQASGRAADNTEQVVRVQQVQTLLLRADALVTNSYLYGGLEPAAARAEYDRSIDEVLRLITAAAEAQPADEDALAELNATVTTYTTTVAQARDYNRQQLPIGIAYLNNAGTTLREDALRIVRAIISANTTRATDEMSARHPWPLLVTGALAVAALWWVNRRIARRFHRRVNVGLAVAAVLVGVGTLVVTVHGIVENGGDADVRDGPYRTAVDEATARTAANDAKAFESTNLIQRGSGAGYDALNWAPASMTVAATASPETFALWERYVEAHEQVRALDDAGEWDQAVALATSTGTDSPTGRLNAFDDASQEVVDSAGADAVDDLRSGRPLALVLAVLTLLVAGIAAAAGVRGIDQRRQEFS